MILKKLFILLLGTICIFNLNAQITFNSFNELTVHGTYFDCCLFKNDLSIVLPKYPLIIKVSPEGTKDIYVDNLPLTMEKLLMKVFLCDYNNVHITKSINNEKLFLVIETLQIHMEKVGSGRESFSSSTGDGVYATYRQFTWSENVGYYSFVLGIKYKAIYKGKIIGSGKLTTPAKRLSKAFYIPDIKNEYKSQVSQSAFDIKKEFNQCLKKYLGINCSFNNSNQNKLNSDSATLAIDIKSKTSHSKKWLKYISEYGIKTDNTSGQYTVKFLFYKNNGKDNVTYNIYDNNTNRSIKSGSLSSDKKFSKYDYSKLYLEIFN